MSGPRCEVPPLSGAQIAQIADGIRRNMQIKTDDFPLIHFLELAMPRLFPGFALEAGLMSDMGANHGLTIPAENVIRLREDVYDGLYRDRGRDRFTAAHELGHYIMHRAVPIVFHRQEHGKLDVYRDSEWQANTFAGDLLMPRSLALQCCSIKEMTERFGVSSQAAMVQNKKLIRFGMKILN
jgi:Zn-dependent peptidase ImmA (M78 family)